MERLSEASYKKVNNIPEDIKLIDSRIFPARFARHLSFLNFKPKWIFYPLFSKLSIFNRIISLLDTNKKKKKQIEGIIQKFLLLASLACTHLQICCKILY